MKVRVMKNDSAPDEINVTKVAGITFGAFVALVMFMVSVGLGASWYRAEAQRKVYERQGVQMTTWEIMLGAKPVERYIKP